jgi:hypothetical protein
MMAFCASDFLTPAGLYQQIRIIIFFVNTAFRNDALTQQLGAVVLWSGDPRMSDQFREFNRILNESA